MGKAGPGMQSRTRNVTQTRDVTDMTGHIGQRPPPEDLRRAAEGKIGVSAHQSILILRLAINRVTVRVADKRARARGGA